jgi:hypothetical protein
MNDERWRQRVDEFPLFLAGLGFDWECPTKPNTRLFYVLMPWSETKTRPAKTSWMANKRSVAIEVLKT